MSFTSSTTPDGWLGFELGVLRRLKFTSVAVPFTGEPEIESGIFVVDKQVCWDELCLTDWMNLHSDFWYRYVLGDKDTFYLSWRKRGRVFSLGPEPHRFTACVTRHFWFDQKPLADHREGTSKYRMPTKVKNLRVLSRYGGRSVLKDIYDEVAQRFVVTNFHEHVRYLGELARFWTAEGN